MPAQQLPTLDEIARAYDQRFSAGDLRESDSFYRWILHLLDPDEAETLLDISCGEGHLLKWGASLRRLDVWGIDISETALERARDCVSQARLIRCDGVRLPFPDRSFRYVTNLGSLEHYTDIPQGIREMARVVRPGGRLAILLPNSYYLADIIWQVWRTGYGPSHRQILERFATLGEWQDLLTAGGIEITSVHAYNFRVPTTWADLQWYRRRPRKLLNLLIAPFLPRNLSYCFLFIGHARVPA